MPSRSGRGPHTLRPHARLPCSGADTAVRLRHRDRCGPGAGAPGIAGGERLREGELSRRSAAVPVRRRGLRGGDGRAGAAGVGLRGHGVRSARRGADDRRARPDDVRAPGPVHRAAARGGPVRRARAGDARRHGLEPDRRAGRPVARAGARHDRPGRRPDRAGGGHRLRRISLNFRPRGPDPRPLSPRLNRKDPTLMSERSTKFIFVTGGVVSSLGKGIAASSFGRLLVSRGLTVGLQKFDPYINVDPGTMSPYQHGEVFVTEDGAETDLDLGHYERFTSTNTTRASNVTAGGIYNAVIKRERRGDYLAATVQVVPHITDELKHRIRLIAETNDVDVVITEIGGTAGDIESLPFLEAIRQFPVDVGRRNVMYVHLTLVPWIGHASELKTKPTQHSVNELRRIGIQPDMLLCRSESELSSEIRKKIALFASLPLEAVISAKDVDNIYKVPLWYEH